ncbi:MAG TPA: serine protease, partial [Thermoanaerobaculia bacterium]|nr:serine protease [Thermoanaerobaculia bacterium]
PLLVAAIVGLGLAWPAAAELFPAEAPAQVMKGGLTAEQHLLRQVELSRKFLRELPAGALDSALQVSLPQEEIAAIDQGSRFQSPLRIGLVQALEQPIVVAGLNRAALDRLPVSGLTGRTADGGFVWAAVVRAEDAGAIRLHVRDLSLPRNAALYVYSRGGEAYGPYVATGPNGTGSFWTTAVFGSEAILQIRFTGPVRNADLRRVSLRVSDIGAITKKFAGELAGILPTDRLADKAGEKALWPCGNESCLVDATCSNVAAANPAKLAIAKMEWPSGASLFTCSGGLISDTNPAQDNFFLTANHCFNKNNTAANVSFYWRYATSSCNGTCPVNTSWPFKTTGATVSATNRKGDFTLGRLTTAPPAGSVFLGWTSAPVANSNNAQLYRISNPQFGPQVYSQHNVDTAVGTCSGWPRGERIYSRDITGAIDGGSSGSPVLNSASQVVGQLSGTCGFDPNNVCAGGPGESNATVDGALAFYFATVKPHINP